jgi:hypothetical protein
MLKAAPTATRAPRGTKPVSQAFFSALETIPEASRVAVGKAAMAMIRDEMKTRRDKMKVAAAKEKEKARSAMPEKPAPVKAAPAKAAPKKRVMKTAPVEKVVEPVVNGAAAPKRRGRKPASETPSA